MKRARRTGFTLVELLVVITIIGMLVALLLPAVQAARESGRRTQCMNNQKQIAFGLQKYESRRAEFPGYLNNLGRDSSGVPIYGSWVVMLLPDLEQNQLWDMWKNPSVAAAAKPVINWELLTCPSDVRDPPSDPQLPNLAYVVNCGIRDGYQNSVPAYIDGPPFGVFFNHDPGSVVGGRVHKVSMDYISQHDGTTYTLLLTENIAADSWSSKYDTSASTYTYVPDEINVGILWDASWEPDKGVDTNPASLSPNPPNINVYKEGDLPRPSARHPGGVVAFFADGHYQFLAETIDYLVYQHLMTPWGMKAGQLAEMNPTPGTPNLRTSPPFDPAKL